MLSNLSIAIKLIIKESSLKLTNRIGVILRVIL